MEQPETPGMSVLEYFTAHILQGFCANPEIFASNGMTGGALVNCKEEDLIEYAGLIAEKTIARLNQGKGGQP
jgi:hypothetical protein